MMATEIYALPNATDMQGPLSFLNYANTVAEGLFFSGILAAAWFVIFIVSLGGTRLNASRAWTVASFICSVLSIPLAITGLIAAKFMYLTFILFAFGIAWIKLENSQGF